MQVGTGWQKYCWGKARADLLPKLPIEVIRTRLNRARELGLDYKAYASVRAKTGHDIVALLFSSNALRVLRAEQTVAMSEVEKLKSLEHCQRLLAVSRPISPRELADQFEAHGIEISASIDAPTLAQSFRQKRDCLRAILKPSNLPGDKILIIGEQMLETDWAEVAQFGAFLPAETYFSKRAEMSPQVQDNI